MSYFDILLQEGKFRNAFLIEDRPVKKGLPYQSSKGKLLGLPVKGKKDQSTQWPHLINWLCKKYRAIP